MVTFSVIVPTIGRPTLARTLQSIIDAGATTKDEILVCADGPQSQARRMCEDFRGRLRLIYHETEATRWQGNVQRNRMLSVASKSHILFMDDDDVYRPGSLGIVRAVATENPPPKILMFRMQSQVPRHQWELLWDVKDIFCGNIGVPMFVLPNRQDLFSRFPEKSGAELEFLIPTLQKWPGGQFSIVWREQVIADIY